MAFQITREDMLRSKVVTPGWYKCKITKAQEGQAKTDGSDKTDVTFVIQDGPFKDVPLDRTFSAKAAGFSVSFIEALLGRKLDDNGWEGSMTDSVGRDILVFVKNDVWQGRTVNRAEDFKSIGAAAA